MILHTVLNNGDSFWTHVKTVSFEEDGCAYTQIGEEDGFMVYSAYGKPRTDQHIVNAWLHDERSMMVLETREWPTRVDREAERL